MFYLFCVVVAHKKEKILAKSVQAPHCSDSHYQNKENHKMKDYSINVTEIYYDNKSLNFISHIDVRETSTSDVNFHQDSIKKMHEVYPDKVKATHSNGAYHRPNYQSYCKNNVEVTIFQLGYPYSNAKADTDEK